MSFTEFIGASGEAYRFVVSDGQVRTPSGGVFAYVRHTANGFELVYVGETENLATGAGELWTEAARAHGATHLLTRLVFARSTRSAEQADLIAAYNPPMNTQSAA